MRRISDHDASPAIAPTAIATPKAATNNQNPAAMVIAASVQRGKATSLLPGPFASALRTPVMSHTPALEGSPARSHEPRRPRSGFPGQSGAATSGGHAFVSGNSCSGGSWVSNSTRTHGAESERCGDGMSASASVYERRSEYLILSLSRTVAGFWIANGWFTRPSGDATPSELGAAVAEALAHSTQGVPTPPRGFSGLQPIRDEIGAHALGRFMRGRLSVGVEATDDGVRVVPRLKLGPYKGSVGIEERAENVEGTSFAVGAAIKRAFEYTSE